MTYQMKFFTYSLGIFFCFFIYGIIEEKIAHDRYGDKVGVDGAIGERFTYVSALVWIQCFFNWIFAKVLLLLKPQKEDTTHQGYYASCSLTRQLAIVSSNVALRWVPYPTQVVGKSAKPIPVMFLGVLVGHKSYSWTRYISVLTIVAGVVLFMYKEDKIATDNVGLGQLLLFLSLSMDGLTGAIQDKVRSSNGPSGQQMMLATNWWSTVMLGVAVLFSGEAKRFVAFVIKHPEILMHVIPLSLVGALGKFFIFLMVSQYGSLACCIATTTRKILTILCSVLFFGNILIPHQWFGIVLVFGGLFADVIFGKNTNQTREKNEKNHINI